jgi:hypothetical protein
MKHQKDPGLVPIPGAYTTDYIYMLDFLTNMCIFYKFVKKRSYKLKNVSFSLFYKYPSKNLSCQKISVKS